MSNQFCFCTLAVGERYRNHARMMAQDIQQHIPATTLLILTDQPEFFQEFPHVLAFKHRLQSVKGYHDKRFVLEKALSLFESCMFLDSDVRILDGVIGQMNWCSGITARAGGSLQQHLAEMKNPQQIQVVEEIAQKLNINLQQVQWLHEFMFAMRRQSGVERKFFQLWQTISYLFELRGIYHGEGCAMGLAAAKVGMTIRFEREDKFPFFKDNIEQVRIKKQQSNLEDKKIYMDVHKNIEYPQRSIFRKLVEKLIKKIVFFYRLLRLRKFAKNDPDFARIFDITSPGLMHSPQKLVDAPAATDQIPQRHRDHGEIRV
ncbi:hypothetical protein [Nostoc sp. FACHB-280]|uniref:hypothetical protein n=1 Tax=Nostoc sp. FACHB-280 TaxID=2692839 RepID=UPI0018F00038|nr:hypothetical protein [Nostoc sp. FACHB-280]